MRRIPLTQAKFAIVDEEDFGYLSKHKWTYATVGYAYRQINKCLDGARVTKTIFMHNQIMVIPVGMGVDHIDGDGMNNTRSNLRICSRSQNMGNTNGQPLRRKSKYKGVMPGKNDKSWVAQICMDGKSTHLGTFKNQEDAATAYNFAAYEYFGEFARLNAAQ